MLRMNHKLIFLFAMIAGCSDPILNFQETGKKEETEKADGDEAATNPVNVNGSFFLTCSEYKTPSANDPNAKVGCAVVGRTSNTKVKLSDYTQKWEWNYKISDAERGSVVIDVQDLKDTHPSYHVVYSFSGTTAALVQQVVDKTRIQSFATAKEGGSPFPTFDVETSQVVQGQQVESAGNPIGTLDPKNTSGMPTQPGGG